MPTISGLTATDRRLCDKIWSMEDQDQVVAWFNTLPTVKRRRAHVMLQLITLALIDDWVDEFDADDMIETRELLDQYK